MFNKTGSFIMSLEKGCTTRSVFPAILVRMGPHYSIGVGRHYTCFQAKVCGSGLQRRVNCLHDVVLLYKGGLIVSMLWFFTTKEG